MLQTARNPDSFEIVYTLSENDFYCVFSRAVPDNARLIGVNSRGMADVEGTPLHDPIHAGALENGTGWVDYL